MYYNHISKLFYQPAIGADKDAELHWLDNSAVTINNRKFVGCTMWFA